MQRSTKVFILALVVLFNVIVSAFSPKSAEAAAVFADVPVGGKEWMQAWVEQFYAAGITTGCGTDAGGNLLYCPERTVTRAELSVFLLRGMHYPNLPYNPSAQSGTFDDVPVSSKEWMESWIEEFADRGITSGCAANPLKYCPENPVTRAEMAVFLLRAKHGATYTPPAATGIFADAPTGGMAWITPWIEELYRESITSGCGTDAAGKLLYCPTREVTRAEMAVFILRTLPNLPKPDSVQKAPALATPGIVGPISGSTVAYNAQPVIFNWDAVNGATGYRLQISTVYNFSSLVHNVTPTSDGWAAQTPLAGGTYYWRVQATNASTTSAWTAVQGLIISTSTPTPTAPEDSPMASQIPYSANSPWNTPIGANPAYDPNSAAMISQMGNGTTDGKIYSDTAQYSYPIYWADKNTPRYNVPCARYKCSMVKDGVVTRVEMIYNVPIPDGAKQSAGNDAQMIIVDTETGVEYGFYHMFKQTDGSWKADNGYVYNINYAGTQPGFGSRGAGVPYYAGMIRPHEIRDGEIRHAIAFVYQFTAATKCVYPASQTDGTTTSSSAIPEGARIQLNPNLTEADFDRWGLGRAGKIVARALQQYGMILIDTGGSPKIIAENLTANTLYGESWSDPDLGYTKDVIANIPYSEFRVLAMPGTGGTPNYGKCFK